MTKKLFLLSFLVIPFVAVNSQSPAPAGFQRWSSPDLESLVKTLKASATTDPHKAAAVTIADYPNELFMEAHREADGVPELHETQADVILVQSGSATLLVGGSLEGANTIAPHEKRNGAIKNAASIKLSPGDVVRIPANTPHQLVLEGAKEVTYFVVKVKNY
jgi:mannose-6-phosphate isomerase-like protein (cupin superfamily)